MAKPPDYEDLLSHPDSYLDELQKSWLRPLNVVQRGVRRVAYTATWWGMRTLFRLQVSGEQNIPRDVQFVLVPNHTSSLDPLALAAAIPYEVLCRTNWTGRKGAILVNPFRRSMNRLALTVPVDRDASALAVAAAVLRRGHNLVWFPEGTRTTTGELQEFKPGIGLLLQHFDVVSVPAFVHGAFEAMPPGRAWPRLTPISLHFGPPLSFAQTTAGIEGSREAQVDHFVEVLRQSVASLQPARNVKKGQRVAR